MRRIWACGTKRRRNVLFASGGFSAGGQDGKAYLVASHTHTQVALHSLVACSSTGDRTVTEETAVPWSRSSANLASFENQARNPFDGLGVGHGLGRVGMYSAWGEPWRGGMIGQGNKLLVF